VKTSRLALLPCAPEHLLTLINDPVHFERVAGLRAAEGLRGFFVSGDVSPAWLAALRDSTGPDPWRHGFFVVHRGRNVVIGSGGFTGPPGADGVVEIAYGIVPAFEGQGYATEVAGALVAFASEHAAVRRISAHTLPVANASTRVLTKCGFHHVGTVVHAEDGPVWRWERAPVSGVPV
jgi:RimJ/RimL family protein N-acetyltransferase